MKHASRHDAKPQGSRLRRHFHANRITKQRRLAETTKEQESTHKPQKPSRPEYEIDHGVEKELSRANSRPAGSVTTRRIVDSHDDLRRRTLSLCGTYVLSRTEK